MGLSEVWRMSSLYVVHHDLDGTWSVREKETGHPALYRGSPVVGLSEKAAVARANRLNASLPFEATPMSEEELQDHLRLFGPHRVTRPTKRLRG
jgi:hypothetical protein